MKQERPGYWAVLPASVRYDETLPPNAKLIYAEISALAQIDGYCWASNQYLAELFGIDKKTASRLVTKLAERGYIRVDVERSEAGQVIQRKIYTGLFSVRPLPAEEGEELPPPSPQNDRDPSPQCGDPSPQKDGDPSPQNCGGFNRKNNQSIEHTPLPPTRSGNDEVREVFQKYVGGDRDLAKLLNDFLEARRKIKKPLQTARAATILVNKLERLSKGDRAIKFALLDNAILHNWASVYPLKADELPQATTGPGQPLRGEGVRYL